VIKPSNPNSEFELGGINHVALVCSDMVRTVDFYSNVLGMPLIKSLDLPGGMGQHFLLRRRQRRLRCVLLVRRCT
jgi:catechol 2,3-dioxygenase-like lactoylglutathione lyase family enzyme